MSGSRYDERKNLVDKPKDKGLTLKDMLSPDMLAKLTEQSNGLKEQERVQQEHKRQAEIARREREQKELENDFEYLLKTSRQDWKDFK
ncbi:YqkE family protein [Tumebacillus sp. DT12]|uniref:YqkE family protein n=1 Tax=Tumebacillus lacus TaxID=2995335 RepID=A0ABT3WZB4_9BACL|nr:YqkE family protein [Tumebacillus lacus]